MKITVELPDDLARRVKAAAALRGRKLKDLVAEGLRLVLEAPESQKRITEKQKRKAEKGPGSNYSYYWDGIDECPDAHASASMAFRCTS